jgi:hypothetical protein
MKHIVILRNSDILTGQIIEKELSIKTSYAELIFNTDQVVHVHFKVLPQTLQDEMLLLTGDTLKGIVAPETFGLKLESSDQIIEIEKEDIHTIMFLDNV